MHVDMAVFLDGEIALTPTGDVVQIAGVFSGPPIDGVRESAPSCRFCPACLLNSQCLKNERSGKRNLLRQFLACL
jgi:hypothetical protein